MGSQIPDLDYGAIKGRNSIHGCRNIEQGYYQWALRLLLIYVDTESATATDSDIQYLQLLVMLQPGQADAIFCTIETSYVVKSQSL